jgi:hypothetical protein
MERKTKEELKLAFGPNELPSDQDFSNLIDTCYNETSGFTGIVEFVGGDQTTNEITVSGGLIVSWNQY